MQHTCAFMLSSNLTASACSQYMGTNKVGIKKRADLTRTEESNRGKSIGRRSEHVQELSLRSKHNHYAGQKLPICPPPKEGRQTKARRKNRKFPSPSLHPRKYENNTKGKKSQAPSPGHNSSSSQTKANRTSAARIKSSYYASCSQPKSPT